MGQDAGEGMPISSGIMVLMYRLDRLVVLVYIRRTLAGVGKDNIKPTRASLVMVAAPEVPCNA
jgi:hypothetical protein